MNCWLSWVSPVSSPYIILCVCKYICMFACSLMFVHTDTLPCHVHIYLPFPLLKTCYLPDESDTNGRATVSGYVGPCGRQQFWCARLPTHPSHELKVPEFFLCLVQGHQRILRLAQLHEPCLAHILDPTADLREKDCLLLANWRQEPSQPFASKASWVNHCEECVSQHFGGHF